MKLPKGYHNEVIEAKVSVDDIDFDTSSLQKRVKTSPLKRGGASFKTNVLVEKSSSRLIYKPSIGAALFSSIFLIVGLGILTYCISSFVRGNFDTLNMNWFLVIAGLIFSGAGVLLFYNLYMPVVFDKQLGLYYKTHRFKLHESKDNQIRLTSIAALQIIGEHVRSDKGSYKSFELNLVLEDGTRKNVIDHGNLKSIIMDAEIISKFLNVPIWHAKSHKS